MVSSGRPVAIGQGSRHGIATFTWGLASGARVMVPVSSHVGDGDDDGLHGSLDGVFCIVIDARAEGVVGGDYYDLVAAYSAPSIRLISRKSGEACHEAEGASVAPLMVIVTLVRGIFVIGGGISTQPTNRPSGVLGRWPGKCICSVVAHSFLWTVLSTSPSLGAAELTGASFSSTTMMVTSMVATGTCDGIGGGDGDHVGLLVGLVVQLWCRLPR